jgi:hypothetical protein
LRTWPANRPSVACAPTADVASRSARRGPEPRTWLADWLVRRGPEPGMWPAAAAWAAYTPGRGRGWPSSPSRFDPALVLATRPHYSACSRVRGASGTLGRRRPDGSRTFVRSLSRLPVSLPASATPDFTVCEIGATRFVAETCRVGGMPRENAKIIFSLSPDRIGSAKSPTRRRSPATFRVATGDSPRGVTPTAPPARHPCATNAKFLQI